jgi:hypothetical protein
VTKSKSLNQLHHTSSSGAQKSYNYRQKGLKTSFDRSSDLSVFQTALLNIREGKSPDDKKTPHFVLIFFKFPLFCVFFPSSHWNSTKPQHFTMRQYSAKQNSGIIYYISQQSHVMHQLVL